MFRNNPYSKKVSMVFTVLIVSLFLATFVVAAVALFRYDQINIFSDISLCSSLDDYIKENKPPVDKYIGEMEYVDSYVHTIRYDGAKFDIFAYEFESDDVAKEYYCVVQKRESVEGDIDYNGRSNLFSSALIVRNKNNVYRVVAGNTFDYLECQKFLNSIFDVNIRD